MPDILLVTTSERVKKVFLSLEESGRVRVRTAASLSLAELGVSIAAPDCTFIHGRVSGQSVDLLIRHMKTILPEDANLAFLAEDPADIAQAAKNGVTVFDLNIDDRTLQGALADVMEDLPNALTGKVIEMQPVLRHDELAPKSAEWEAEEDHYGAAGEHGAAMRAALRLQSYGKGDGESGTAPPPGESTYREVQDRVTVNASPMTGHPTVRELLDQVDPSQFSRAKPRRFVNGKVVLAAAAFLMICAVLPLLRKSLHPALASYDNPARQGPVRAAAAPATGKRVITPAVPAVAAATPAAAVRRAPVVAVAQAPVAAPAAGPQTAGSKPAQPSRQTLKGLPSLPPMLAQCRLDEEFSKTHQGWERYVGADFEYRLLRRDGVYRSMKVLPRKSQPVPEQFLKKVLLQFGGADSYKINAVEKRGRLMVGRGRVKSDVVISIYKDGADRSIKRFVIYYE
jgi:hypothetical protein